MGGGIVVRMPLLSKYSYCWVKSQTIVVQVLLVLLIVISPTLKVVVSCFNSYCAESHLNKEQVVDAFEVRLIGSEWKCIHTCSITVIR